MKTMAGGLRGKRARGGVRGNIAEVCGEKEQMSAGKMCIGNPKTSAGGLRKLTQEEERELQNAEN